MPSILLEILNYFKETLLSWSTLKNKNSDIEKQNYISFCNDIVKAVNDVFKKQLKKILSYHNNVFNIKSHIEEKYKNNKNKNIEKELNEIDDELKLKEEDIKRLNEAIKRNNNLLLKMSNDKVESKESSTEKRVIQMLEVQDEALKIFTKKNRDYGDAFATYGPIGVIVRIGDKINRLNSITRNGIIMVNDEGVRDTLIDLHNYCAMAVMLMNEKEENKNENVLICEAGLGTHVMK